MRVLIAEYHLPEKINSDYVDPSGELNFDRYVEGNCPHATRIEERPDAMDAAGLIRYIDSRREAILARGSDPEPEGLRDRLAMAATADEITFCFLGGGEQKEIGKVCEARYAWADAMMEARGKK